MSQFHIQQILGFGPDPLSPFETMSLNPGFFLKASLSKKLIFSKTHFLFYYNVSINAFINVQLISAGDIGNLPVEQKEIKIWAKQCQAKPSFACPSLGMG